jgi:hypothetical protein
MSKVDAQRAMREAKYASNRAGSPSRSTATPAAASTPAARTPAAKPARAEATAPSAATPADGARCLHENADANRSQKAHAGKVHSYLVVLA